MSEIEGRFVLSYGKVGMTRAETAESIPGLGLMGKGKEFNFENKSEACKEINQIPIAVPVWRNNPE